MAKGNLKAKAFQLFDEGKNASSPEVKALGIKGATRYSYYSNWKKGRAEGGEPEAGAVKLPGGESIGGYDETKVEGRGKEREKEEVAAAEEKLEEKPVFEGEKREEVLPEELREVSIPAEIIGFGLPIKVSLSLKTLALYQIAATTSKNLGGNNLSLGDFLDQCVEDFFVGRGSDLGLIKLAK